MAWEAEERKTDWNQEIDTACSLRQWAERYLDHAEKYSRKTYNEKRQALRELFAAKQGTGRRQVAIVDPDAPVASLTPGKVLACICWRLTASAGGHVRAVNCRATRGY